MNIEGKIKVIFAENVISEKFKKREFVIRTNDEYPQDIMIEVINEKCDLLNHFREGDAVNASINIRGRAWMNPEGVERYFNTIQAWRIDKIGEESGSGNPIRPMGNIEGNFAEDAIQHMNNELEEDDDLPF